MEMKKKHCNAFWEDTLLDNQVDTLFWITNFRAQMFI